VTYRHALVCRGEADRAFEWLDKAVACHGGGLAEIVGSPPFANLRQDPRWLPFLRKLGKAPEQLAATEFDVKLPNRAREDQATRLKLRSCGRRRPSVRSTRPPDSRRSRQAASGRTRANSVRYWGAILAGMTARRAVTRQSHAAPRAFVTD
jgi:hypothetical protein